MSQHAHLQEDLLTFLLLKSVYTLGGKKLLSSQSLPLHPDLFLLLVPLPHIIYPIFLPLFLPINIFSLPSITDILLPHFPWLPCCKEEEDSTLPTSFILCLFLAWLVIFGECGLVLLRNSMHLVRFALGALVPLDG